MSSAGTIESGYVIWDSAVVKGACTIRGMAGLTKPFLLKKDAPLGEAYTQAASCRLIDVDPRRIVIPDNLINTSRALFVSVRLKEFLVARKLTDIEYLPFALADAEDKKIPGLLFLLHPLNSPDCLDVRKCEPTYSTIIEGHIDDMKQIVFKEDPRRDLFRAKDFAKVFFVSRSLAKAIHEAGFTGVQFWEIEGYLEEGKSAIAFGANVAMTSLDVKPAAEKRSYRKPPKECESWIDSLVKQFKETKSSASNFVVNGQSFIAQWGDDEWLDSYNEESSPAFDSKRYHAIGFNGGSDYWLLDLVDLSVVYFSHELGYEENNCEKVAKDWQSFSSQVKKR